MTEETLDELLLKAYQRGFKDGDKCTAESIAKARNETLQECMEIASEHNGCVDTKCLSESNCGATIANQIYALKSEEGK